MFFCELIEKADGLRNGNLKNHFNIESLKLMSFSVFAGSFRLPLQLAVSFSIIKARVSI